MEPQSTKGDLRATLLTWDHCKELSRKLPSSEKMECLANGHSPEQALAAGLLFGLSWAVIRDPILVPAWSHPGAEAVGAFGYTQAGHIWSLWGPLSRRESVDILKLSREWIPHLVHLSGRERLTNHVHVENHKAIAWLQATGCINLDTANPKENLDGSESYAFETFAPRASKDV